MSELGFGNQSDFDLKIASSGPLLVWFLVEIWSDKVWFWDFLVWFSAWQHCRWYLSVLYGIWTYLYRLLLVLIMLVGTGCAYSISPIFHFPFLPIHTDVMGCKQFRDGSVQYDVVFWWIVIQCMAVQFSTVQGTEIQNNVRQCITVLQYSAVQIGVMRWSAGQGICSGATYFCRNHALHKCFKFLWK